MKTHAKANISMRQDLFDYIEKCVLEHNSDPKNRYSPTDRSKIVQKAIALMMEQESEQKLGHSKPQGSVADVVQPSKNSVGGLSIVQTKNSRRVGNAK